MSVSSVLAAAPDQPGFGDDAVLDEFTIPFGTWTEQAVNWTVLNLDWLLDAIAWPFEFLLDNVVDNGLLAVPWWTVVLAMFLLAWLVRNLSVAVGAAAGLVVCGLLGQEYWIQTARTIGLIIVAVVIMLVAAKPIGDFVDRHPTIKILALSFLILVGVTLIVEGFDVHVPKGYIYFAMAFSISVEMLNIRMRKKAALPVKLHKQYSD